MDVGASTGGFTDCLLRRGARKVYSIDVGYGQLAWSLRQDPRVKCMERTNIRYVTPDMLEETPSLCVIDVSFHFPQAGAAGRFQPADRGRPCCQPYQAAV